MEIINLILETMIAAAFVVGTFAGSIVLGNIAYKYLIQQNPNAKWLDMFNPDDDI